MAADVDTYIVGSQMWPDEMTRLRSILLDSGLTEGIKWGKPCYSHEGSNIAIMQEMKDFLALMFFKGALLDDPAGVLQEQGPNSRSARRICFTSVDDVTRLTDTLTALHRRGDRRRGVRPRRRPGTRARSGRRTPTAARRRPGAAECVRGTDPGSTAGVQPVLRRSEAGRHPCRRESTSTPRESWTARASATGEGSHIQTTYTMCPDTS